MGSVTREQKPLCFRCNNTGLNGGCEACGRTPNETAKEFIKRKEAENGIVSVDLLVPEPQPDFTPMFPEDEFATAFEYEVQKAYMMDRPYDWFMEGMPQPSKYEHLKYDPSLNDGTPSGGSNAYYKLPEGAEELGDLIEYKDMNFNVGNIFKAAYRLGEKAGNTKVYDLEKIIWFAKRELARERKKQG